MTRSEKKIYNMVADAYKKHGSELVEEKYSGLMTCEVKEHKDNIKITINTEIPYVNTWFEMIAEFENELKNDGYNIAESRFMCNYFYLIITK